MNEFKCTCESEYIEDHPCPFKEDIGDEGELPYEERSMCNCCDYCTNNCAMDI